MQWHTNESSKPYKTLWGQGEDNTIQAAIGALHAPDQASEKSAFICMSGSHQRAEGEERSDTQQQENLDVCVCACGAPH